MLGDQGRETEPDVRKGDNEEERASVDDMGSPHDKRTDVLDIGTDENRRRKAELYYVSH